MNMGLASAAQSKVTELLRLAGQGDQDAQDKVFRVVYVELRRLARRALRDERSNHTLQPTALVHEAFVRLVGNTIPWPDRAHFFAIAARTMRRILVDYARALGTRKRGWGNRVDLDGALVFSEDRAPVLIALDEAMTRFEANYPRPCKVVEMLFFTGLTAEEAAASLGVSLKTVRRDWKFARAWLHAELDGNDQSIHPGHD
jgi:RNA polymerase sigma-70 factor (ECF subfamily)